MCTKIVYNVICKELTLLLTLKHIYIVINNFNFIKLKDEDNILINA